MKSICFLSCQDLTGHVVDEQLAIDKLQDDGAYAVTTIPWDDEADWTRFDAVIVRTTWDYVQRAEEFIKKLKFISTQTKLLNSAEIIEWNYHKGYLKELESKGVEIVPTQMFTYPAKIEIPSEWSFDQFIVKPAISATAYKTMLLLRAEIESESFKSELYPGQWLLQPFLNEIKQGEISLFYFRGVYSHAIIKRPKSGDFRVQEEHGGDIQELTPTQELKDLGKEILGHVPSELLLARVDLVESGGSYQLMELELIEPSLYFRKSSEAPKNFRIGLDKIFKP